MDAHILLQFRHTETDRPQNFHYFTRRKVYPNFQLRLSLRFFIRKILFHRATRQNLPVEKIKETKDSIQSPAS